MSKFPSELLDKFIVRFPPGMRDQIAAEAKKNMQSMNAELIARLRESFESAQSKTGLRGSTCPVIQPGHQFKFRLPESLSHALRDAATEGNRSMSAEIVERLEKSFGSTDVEMRRDFFAAAALVGYRAHPANERVGAIGGVAQYCYQVADAMLAERAK